MCRDIGNNVSSAAHRFAWLQRKSTVKIYLLDALSCTLWNSPVTEYHSSSLGLPCLLIILNPTPSLLFKFHARHLTQANYLKLIHNCCSSASTIFTSSAKLCANCMPTKRHYTAIRLNYFPIYICLFEFFHSLFV